MLQAKSIGNKIADARKRNNLSQAELAQQVAISPQAVGKWERGESMPDIATLNRLAELLGVDLNFFSDSFVSKDQDTVSPKISNTNQTNETSKKISKKFDWNWDMSQGNWTDADFSGLKNLKEKFSSSNMKNCKFIGADLSGLTLGRNNIERCDFSGANIRDSKFQNSNLSFNQFNDCSFIDSVFTKNNIEKCDFTNADFSGAEIVESNWEHNIINQVSWKFTKFFRSNLNKITFTGTIENGHFEHCSFYNVTFENVTFLNTFFKYNDRFKKVQFINCNADSITYAFLKNNQANLSGITLIDA